MTPERLDSIKGFLRRASDESFHRYGLTQESDSLFGTVIELDPLNHIEYRPDPQPVDDSDPQYIPPTGFMKPVSGRISSRFGPRGRPTAGASRYHKGLDFAVPIGTKVRASQSGEVSVASSLSGYGLAVYIEHAGGYQTRYAHNSKLLVRVGERVQKGQVIALSGNTGVSSGPHVHFEIRLNNVALNPERYVN